jgi:hypothetical protein
MQTSPPGWIRRAASSSDSHNVRSGPEGRVVTATSSHRSTCRPRLPLGGPASDSPLRRPERRGVDLGAYQPAIDLRKVAVLQDPVDVRPLLARLMFFMASLMATSSGAILPVSGSVRRDSTTRLSSQCLQRPPR